MDWDGTQPRPVIGHMLAISKTVDYVARDAASNKNATTLALAQELARYCLQSFSLQVSEHPEAVKLREICYAILRTKL